MVKKKFGLYNPLLIIVQGIVKDLQSIKPPRLNRLIVIYNSHSFSSDYINRKCRKKNIEYKKFRYNHHNILNIF